MASKAPKNAQDLLDVMSLTIQALRDGTTTPAVANATVNSTGTMIRIVKLQMDYAKMTNTTPTIPLLLTKGDDE